MHVFLKDLKPNQAFTGVYLIKNPEIRQSKTNKPYLSGSLQDSSGTVSFKFWNFFDDMKPYAAGGPVYLEADTISYQNQVSVILTSLRPLADGEEYDAACLVPSAPVSLKDYKHRMHQLIGTIQDPDYKLLLQVMLGKYAQALITSPAARGVHHAFHGGLLVHTVNIMNLADTAAKQYPHLDRDLLLTAALLHDIGKPAGEFQYDAMGLVSEYTCEGQLYGHLVIGAEVVKAACQQISLPIDKTRKLIHCILSHHGEPEWGAAVRPAIPEADLLAKLDALDATMEVFRTSLDQMESQTASRPLSNLGNRRIYKF